MHILFDSLDGSSVLLEIKSLTTEILDEHNYGLLRIILKENEANIISCEYEGYNMKALLDTLKSTGILDVDPKTFRVYREFKAIVKYEDYKSLNELVTLNNIVSQSKSSEERKHVVNTTKAWEKLDILKV